MIKVMNLVIQNFFISDNSVMSPGQAGISSKHVLLVHV